jgi:hypothetical protein
MKQVNGPKLIKAALGLFRQKNIELSNLAFDMMRYHIWGVDPKLFRPAAYLTYVQVFVKHEPNSSPWNIEKVLNLEEFIEHQFYSKIDKL